MRFQLLDLLLRELRLPEEPILGRIAAIGDVNVVAGRFWSCRAGRTSVHTVDTLVLRHKWRIRVVDLHLASLCGPFTPIPDTALDRRGSAHRVGHVDLLARVMEDADHLVIYKPSAHNATIRGRSICGSCFRGRKVSRGAAPCCRLRSRTRWFGRGWASRWCCPETRNLSHRACLMLWVAPLGMKTATFSQRSLSISREVSHCLINRKF